MNKPSNDYNKSKLTINYTHGVSDLPEELYESNIIDWLQDEIDTYDFHGNKEEFLDFIKDSGFDKIYHISVYAHDIDKYKDIKSIYNLLSHCKNAAGMEKLQLVILKKGNKTFNSKEQTDEIISKIADEYVANTEKSRNEIIDLFKDSFDVSNLGNENIKNKLIETLNQEPNYGRIMSNGGKYKYLVGGGKGSKANSGKYYIDALKNNGIDMIEIE